MKILVVGNGGREHALAWKLLQSANVEKVYCCPGNGGTATLNNCQNVPIKVDDFASMKDLVQQENINLIVVGPELPLSLGVKDQLRSLNIP
ncbi:MAG: phosphoribosylamine--glycine ligase, partial [Microcoleaceae cyanobacterium]